ncbi:hypothetical protein EVAR_3426_1 [Eumeta japonica]|uniref:Uncharacterized protein n=1 Tax=Eumeta variegata TaxID=151549 RepID=A0A4C1ST58_EUMVA|nr:hypothetical protein EVAR_3426_1 [Eumeta japonica]
MNNAHQESSQTQKMFLETGGLPRCPARRLHGHGNWKIVTRRRGPGPERAVTRRELSTLLNTRKRWNALRIFVLHAAARGKLSVHKFPHRERFSATRLNCFPIQFSILRRETSAPGSRWREPGAVPAEARSCVAKIAKCTNFGRGRPRVGDPTF